MHQQQRANDAMKLLSINFELADAAGFPSTMTLTNPIYGNTYPIGECVAPYVLDRYECIIRRKIVLVAFSRFCHNVHNADGSENEKVSATVALFAPPPLPPLSLFCELPISNYTNNAGRFLHCMNCGGGTNGLLRHVLEYV